MIESPTCPHCPALLVGMVVSHATWCPSYNNPEPEEEIPMAKKPKKNGTKIPAGVHIVKHDLPCQLTAEESQAKAEKAARLYNEVDEIQEKIDNSLKDLRAEKKQKAGEARGLMKEVAAHEEIRSVKCYEERDYSAGEIRVVRVDTGESVKDKARTMTAEERQGTLPLDKKKRGRAKGAAEEPAPEADGEPAPDA